VSKGSDAPSQRQLRVAEELRHALAEALRDVHFRDPDLLDVNITVTEVQIGADLRQATAFVLPLAGATRDAEETRKLVAALNRTAPFLRGVIARSVKLRYAPGLKFEADNSFDQADRIESLLRGHVVPDLD
jgi:ribosome-binding factor A